MQWLWDEEDQGVLIEFQILETKEGDDWKIDKVEKGDGR